MMKLVFASNNVYKIQEIQNLLPKNIQIISLKDIGCFEEIPETGLTIEENAILKANYITQKFGYDCFADDTGLEVESLNGAPGVYSARYAGEQKDSYDNMNLLLERLKYQKNRNAQFKTIIALNYKSEQFLFEGIALGEITHQLRGTQGFGYDPIFQPVGFIQTFAELSLSEKNQNSHRAKAVKKLVGFLGKQTSK